MMGHYLLEYPLTIFDTSGKIFFNNQVRNKMSCSTCKFYTNEEKTIFDKLMGECEWSNFHNLPYYLSSQENYVYSDDGDFCETYIAKTEVKNNV